MKRLSPWMWLWIVVTVALWGLGTWQTIADLGLPPGTATKNEACTYYGVGTAPNNHAEYVRRCLADPAVEAEARASYLSAKREWFAMFLAFWFFLPIIPGIVICVIAWAWRARKSL